jgi:ribose 5-phosphate isomerase B
VDVIAMGADHGGYELKQKVLEYLQAKGYKVIDFGTNGPAAVDYPDYALAVGKSILKGEATVGIVFCGSGVGASMAANKIPGIRAGLCHDTYSAHQGREHDDMNVLCLGARVIGFELAFELVNSFLQAKFSQEERHPGPPPVVYVQF